MRALAALSIETGIPPQYLLDPEISDVVDAMLDLYREGGEKARREKMRQALRGSAY